MKRCAGHSPIAGTLRSGLAAFDQIPRARAAPLNLNVPKAMPKETSATSVLT